MDNTIDRLRRASLSPDLVGDEIARNVSAFPADVLLDDEPPSGQVQIGDPGYTWILHLSGTPASWRHLAKVIEDAAMDLERQIAEQAHTDPGEHYAEQAAESGVRT